MNMEAEQKERTTLAMDGTGTTIHLQDALLQIVNLVRHKGYIIV